MISERCLMVRYPTRLLHSMLYNDKGATAHKVKNAYPAIYPFRHRPYIPPCTTTPPFHF